MAGEALAPPAGAANPVVDGLHRAWARRRPVVVALAVDAGRFRAPRSYGADEIGDPWLLAPGFGEVIVSTRRGALHPGDDSLDPGRAALAERTNARGVRGTPDEMLAGADVLIGVSVPGSVSAAGVRTMAPDAIVFAMANRHHRRLLMLSPPIAGR